MSKVVDYYFSLASPFTYLGGERFAALAARHGAVVHHKPKILADVFAVSGGLPLAKRAPQRRAYRLVEMARWSAHLGIPIVPEPRHFPVDDSLAARMVIAAAKMNDPAAGRLARAVLRAVWIEERDIADRATLTAIGGEAGLDGRALLAAADGEDAARLYRANTDEAIARGVFGAPTWIIEGEMFWGQDRLEFVEQALARV
ncbi:MAG: 2-hydroxychromene-2-carboxylate isomerase [Alphaproteobacteria bacterium]